METVRGIDQGTAFVDAMESLSRPNVMPTNVDKLAVAGDQDGLAATSAQAAPARDLTKTSLTPSQSASCTRRERGNSSFWVWSLHKPIGRLQD